LHQRKFSAVSRKRLSLRAEKGCKIEPFKTASGHLRQMLKKNPVKLSLYTTFTGPEEAGGVKLRKKNQENRRKMHADLVMSFNESDDLIDWPIGYTREWYRSLQKVSTGHDLSACAEE